MAKFMQHGLPYTKTQRGSIMPTCLHTTVLLQGLIFITGSHKQAGMRDG